MYSMDKSGVSLDRVLGVWYIYMSMVLHKWIRTVPSKLAYSHHN